MLSTLHDCSTVAASRFSPRRFWIAPSFGITFWSPAFTTILFRILAVALFSSAMDLLSTSSRYRSIHWSIIACCAPNLGVVLMPWLLHERNAHVPASPMQSADKLTRATPWPHLLERSKVFYNIARSLLYSPWGLFYLQRPIFTITKHVYHKIERPITKWSRQLIARDLFKSGPQDRFLLILVAPLLSQDRFD